MSKKNEIYKITLSAFFIGLSYVLPFLTGQIPQIGSMLCPMHIPVLLCGYICGWKYGIIVGLTSPLIRSLTLSMPPMFPTALCMSLELATYGLISGFLYNLLPKKTINIYVSLFIAMLCGRAVWGTAMFSFLGFSIEKFSFFSFWTGAFANAIPGIIIQILFIPVIILVYNTVIKKVKN